MATLYVVEPGTRLEKEYKRILVTRHDEVLQRIPLAKLSHVVLVGSVGMTTRAMFALLDHNIPVALISSTGRLRGRLASPMSRNVKLRHLQYQRASDPQFCLSITQAIVAGKLRNERTMARRICRSHQRLDDSGVETLSRSIEKIPHAQSIASVRGLEGASARAFFRLFIQALDRAWDTKLRSRRPPKDALNALLGLGFSLLCQNAMTALEVVGLDPYDGFLHAEKYGRPSLALDLMEEFRSLIVNSIVLTLVNKRILKTEHFTQNDVDGIHLRSKGLRRFFKQYNRRMQTEVYHPMAGRKLTYQKCIEVQAWMIRKTIEGQEAKYIPLLVR